MLHPEHSVDDIRRTIGDELTDRMLKVFCSNGDAIEWFYRTNLTVLDGKTPYEQSRLNPDALKEMLDVLGEGA